MTVYSVNGETFSSLKDAKAEMKRTGEKGYKTKIYSNGDWVPCGEITLSGNNKCRVEGSKHCNSY